MWKDLSWPDGLRLWSQQATKKNIKLCQEFLGGLSKYRPWSRDLARPCKNHCIKGPLVEVLAAVTCINGPGPVKLPQSDCSGTTPIISSNKHISLQIMSYCAYYNAIM